MTAQYYRTYSTIDHANAGKRAAVVALLPHWQSAADDYAAVIWRRALTGETVPTRLSGKQGIHTTLNSALSARQLESVYQQTSTTCRSWLSNRANEIGEVIRCSLLDRQTKVILWALNNHSGDHGRVFSFPDGVTIQLYCDRDGLLHATRPKGKDIIAFELEVDRSTLRLFHSIRTHVWNRHRKPSFHHGTMVMDGKVALIENSRTDMVDVWVRVSTLTSGKPVWIPLELTEYHRVQPGVIANMCQVVVHDGTVDFKLVNKADVAQPRDGGRTVGLDFGCTTVFATSDGQLLGGWTWTKLKELDQRLTTLTAALQSNGLKPSTSRRYRKLCRRIRAMVTNEINRLLNRLSDEDIRTIVVEKLDFRGGGMSRQMNRLIARTGRAAVEKKLTALSEQHGIVVQHVNPAYTSQQCSACGNVDRGNRHGQRFACRFCGLRCDADVNGARNVRERFLDGNSWLRSHRTIVRQRLDGQFRQRWGCPPTGGATKKYAGARVRLPGTGDDSDGVIEAQKCST